MATHGEQDKTKIYMFTHKYTVVHISKNTLKYRNILK